MEHSHILARRHLAKIYSPWIWNDTLLALGILSHIIVSDFINTVMRWFWQKNVSIICLSLGWDGFWYAKPRECILKVSISLKHLKCFEFAFSTKQLLESQPVNACKPMMASRSCFDTFADISFLFSCLLLFPLPVSKIAVF